MPRPAATAIPGGASTALRRAFLLALSLGLAALPAAAAVQGFHYTREIEVPSPGWVRVPLDLAALQHMAPGAADLHVFAPAGSEVSLRVEAAAPHSERRPLVVPRPGRVGDGWELVLDAGADPLPRERLFLQAVRPPLAPPDRIESSPDGSAWQPLAVTEPLRTDGGEDSAGWVSVSYPATGDRYLRLHWPRGAEPPRIAAAEVEAVTGPTLSVTTRDAECDTARPGEAFCTLTLPAPGQIVRQLTLEITGAGNVGHLLDEPREAHWYPLAEGVWQRTGGRTRHLIAGGPAPVADSVLRLELYGSTQDPPRLASWSVEIKVQTVLFRAGEAGRYTLAYGGAPRAEARQEEAVEAADAVWLEAGAEIEHAPPPLPVTATAPSVRLESRRLAAAWRVVAPSAKPRFLVRLELPDIVYGATRADLGNLRLVAGERQIPFYRWSPAAPALVDGRQELEPSPRGRRSAESEVEIHLPQPGLPLTELDLTAPAGLLRRTIGVRYLEPARNPRKENGARKESQAAVRQTWECHPQPPLPCRERLSLPGRAPQVLSVRFHDGDNPPLASVEADVWRRRDVLLFVWPEVEEDTPVRLLAGPDTLSAPSYDLGALGEALLSHPWQPAELDLEGEAAPANEPWWSHWVRPMILLIAAVGLVLLLRRILAEA
ncbi:MAG TPA: DUF3999 family protein [Thermoanaerobaculia bacterium]|jgi:hypothetical protein